MGGNDSGRVQGEEMVRHVQRVTRHVLFYKDDRGCIHSLACSGDISFPAAIRMAKQEYKVEPERICRTEVITEERIVISRRELRHNIEYPGIAAAIKEFINNRNKKNNNEY